MQSRPADFDPSVLATALTREWGVAVADLAYAPVGFGSHHWTATDPAGGRWFVTVDDLRSSRHTETESFDAAFDRLRRALDTARALRDTGAKFVVAPVPTAGGNAVVRLGPIWAGAVYAHVDGESFEWGATTDETHRQGVLDMIVGLHAAPPTVTERTAVDDLAVPHRDAVEAGPSGRPAPGDGPYSARTAALLTRNAEAIAGWLARYDAMAATVERDRDVLTHGEPHPGNTMRTADGWRLIDWDTALVAPPERDLWMAGDEVTEAYATATGVVARPEVVDAYRLRWDITDFAVGAARFRDTHAGDADDAENWEIMMDQIGKLTA